MTIMFHLLPVRHLGEKHEGFCLVSRGHAQMTIAQVRPHASPYLVRPFARNMKV